MGGRLATRRLDGERFDHGAQFFTARNAPLRESLDQWMESKLVRPWFGEPDRIRYCGVADMNSIAKELLRDLEVRRQFKVENVSFSEGVWTVRSESESLEGKRLLLTCPAPQALELLQSSGVESGDAFLDTLGTIQYDRCISLMLLLKNELGLSSSGILQLDTGEPIVTLVETSVKGTTNRPGLVIQSGPKFAAKNYGASPEELFRRLTEALPSMLRLDVEEMSVQKWKFAKRRPHDLTCSYAEDGRLPLWHAGDGYVAPRIEGAYESGLAVAASILNAAKKLQGSRVGVSQGDYHAE